MEAAGIEPASEKARHDKTTCVADSSFSFQALRTDEEEPGLSPIDLDPRLRAEA